MKFTFDTEKLEDINLQIEQEADLEENILDLCFGMSAIFVDFCMQLGLDQEQTRSLLDVCQSCMTRNVDDMLSKGLLEADDEDAESDGVSDEELDELERGMIDAGFSEEEISSIAAMVQEAGSMEAALDILKGIAEDAGIDLPDLED